MTYKIHICNATRQQVADMNEETLLRHIMCPQFFATQNKEPPGDFGALFFHAASTAEHRKTIATFASHCHLPPLITTDMECGPGTMITDATQFPPLLALGMAADSTLAYAAGKAAAEEARALGINWSLSPCVDMLATPTSPMVSTRSAGKSAQRIIDIAGAYMNGLQENGVISTLKHFPGDGYDVVDQHLTVPCNPLSKSQWMAGPGRIYKDLIDAGAMTIMPGHIALPAFDVPTLQTGLFPPASLSSNLLTGLLKDTLKFDGLIVSDAVNMGGFAGVLNLFDACAVFLEAGGDMILFPPVEMFVREMRERLRNGRLSMDTLRRRVERIVAVKRAHGILTSSSTSSKNTPNRQHHTRTAKKIIEKSIRVVRDRSNRLPLSIEQDTRIGHVVISTDPDKDAHLMSLLTDALTPYTSYAETIEASYPEQLFDAAYSGNYDLFICSVCVQPTYGTNICRLHGPVARLMMGGWMHLNVPVVFIAHFHPFLGDEFPYAIDTLVTTHGSVPATMPLLIQTLTQKKSP